MFKACRLNRFCKNFLKNSGIGLAENFVGRQMSHPLAEYQPMFKGNFTQMELITPCPHGAGIITRSLLTRLCGRVRQVMHFSVMNRNWRTR